MEVHLMELPESSRLVFSPAAWLAVVWRHKWLVLSFSIFASILTIAISFFLIEPVYSSSADLLVKKTGIEKALFGTAIVESTKIRHLSATCRPVRKWSNPPRSQKQ